jgi:hypothetical protein
MTELFLRSDPFAEFSAGIGNGIASASVFPSATWEQGAAVAKDFFGNASITS